MPTHLGDDPQRIRIEHSRSTPIALRRTLTRKTSLLHKIDPTARRSGFADGSGFSNQIISHQKALLITDY